MLSRIHKYVIIFYIYAIATSAVLKARNDADKKGYECGRKFFTFQYIGDSLFVAGYNFRKSSSYPMPYQGKLYTNTLRYMIWPLKEDGSEFKPQHDTVGPYFMVLNDRFKVIDVIALMKDQNFIKCAKVDRSQPTRSTPAPWEGDGYQCGHRYFRDTEIKEALVLKFSTDIKLSQSFQTSGSHLRLLPIGSVLISEEELVDRSPYRLVIGREKNIINMVAKIIDSNFVKCQRSWSPEAAKAGYQCGKVFFDINFLMETLKTAGTQENRRLLPEILHKKFDDRLYPLLPITSTKLLGLSTSNWPYWLVLGRDLQTINPIMIYDSKSIKCERRVIEGKIYYNERAFNCNGHFLWEEELNRAAQLGCALEKYRQPMLDETFNWVPDRHINPIVQNDFPLKGQPYCYVIYDKNCEVKGALYEASNMKLVKCRKI